MRTSKKARKRRSRGVQLALQRGKAVVAALIGTAVISAYSVGIGAWQVSLLHEIEGGAAPTSTLQLSDKLYNLGVFAQLALLLTAAVLFLRWLSQTVNVVRDLQVSPPLAWTASQAVWGFFIPFINLTRPYQVLRDLHDVLAPDGVPEPAPRPRLDGASGYRKIEMEKAPPPAKLPHASIGLWWAFYLLGGLVSRVAASSHEGRGALALISSRTASVASNVFEVVSAGLAILVVLAISARLAERQRRLRYASDEELVSWGIDA